MSGRTLFAIAIIVVILFGIVLCILRVLEGFEMQKRYANFSLDPIKDDQLSVFDMILIYYKKIKKKLSRFFKKSKVLRDYSKKYEKYLNKIKKKKEDSMDYISAKIVFGFISVILIFISNIFQLRFPPFYEILFAFLVGFFMPDLYWLYMRRVRKKQVERDMIKAIIIMNNSFKSGLSIMQAIYMVSNELEGSIAEEFKKMYIDISFGLDMDIVFKRFAKRINTEEAHYITTSLSVLNKTGGNIVQVFSSVERSAFTRKKLQEELGALSASSSLIYKILVAVPILLVTIIMLLNPSYFAPLFKTTVGKFIIFVMLAMYVSYIVIIRKIVNIKE